MRTCPGRRGYRLKTPTLNGNRELRTFRWSAAEGFAELALPTARGQQRRPTDSAGNWPRNSTFAVCHRTAPHSSVSSSLDLALRAPLPPDLE